MNANSYNMLIYYFIYGICANHSEDIATNGRLMEFEVNN